MPGRSGVYACEGHSRQATPTRNFHTTPLSTVRSSSRGRPLDVRGSNG
jgi:hypothetical protein